jgi:hypothetical protein
MLLASLTMNSATMLMTSPTTEGAAVTLSDVIEIGHAAGIKVVVDGYGQL